VDGHMGHPYTLIPVQVGAKFWEIRVRRSPRHNKRKHKTIRLYSIIICSAEDASLMSVPAPIVVLTAAAAAVAVVVIVAAVTIAVAIAVATAVVVAVVVTFVVSVTSMRDPSAAAVVVSLLPPAITVAVAETIIAFS